MSHLHYILFIKAISIINDSELAGDTFIIHRLHVKLTELLHIHKKSILKDVDTIIFVLLNNPHLVY